MSRFIAVLIGLSLTSSQPALATDPISDIAAHPMSYDGKTVDITGIVRELREKTSRKGNDYDTFKLCSTSCLSVFIFGRPAIADGKVAEVRGTFQAVHRVSSYTFYNEIEAESVR